MPFKMWKHKCENSDYKEIENGDEICPNCGQRGEYSGWRLSVIEMMSAYQRRTGFRSIGPHRAMTDELLGSRMKRCEQCNGDGLIYTDGEDFQTCPRCNMGQMLFDGTPEEFEAIRQKIMEVYPEADPKVPLTEATRKVTTYVGGGFFSPKPKDRSLQAYKDWSKNILDATKTNSGDDGSMTEEKWVKSWEEYWSKVDVDKDKPDMTDQ